MKKLSIISGGICLMLMVACSDVKREPGRIYMPDMAYSRAYETYSPRDTNFTSDPSSWDANGNVKIFYNNMPVAGSVSRGEDYLYHITKDKPGDSSNYSASKQTANPLTTLDADLMKEAERIYLINCAICHGTKLDGNGPLYKDGAGPYPAKPATLNGTDPVYRAMTDGQMFYSITYGKNLMGAYASQVTPHQRWMIVSYIKSFQGKAATAAVPAAGATQDSASKTPAPATTPASATTPPAASTK